MFMRTEDKRTACASIEFKVTANVFCTYPKGLGEIKVTYTVFCIYPKALGDQGYIYRLLYIP